MNKTLRIIKRFFKLKKEEMCNSLPKLIKTIVFIIRLFLLTIVGTLIAIGMLTFMGYIIWMMLIGDADSIPWWGFMFDSYLSPYLIEIVNIYRALSLIIILFTSIIACIVISLKRWIWNNICTAIKQIEQEIKHKERED